MRKICCISFALLCCVLMVASCGGGSGGGGGTVAPTGTLISGTVSAPPGVSLGRTTGRTAAATGLVAKAGATVEVYRINDTGARTGNILASSSTGMSGLFNLTLPIGVSINNINLVVSVGSGNNVMRAIVTSTSLKINPITELVVSRITANSQPLSTFTVAEISSIQTQAETDSASVNLSSATTISSAVTTLYTGTLKTNFDNNVVAAGGGVASPVCGNGIIDTGETCDDENTVTENCAYGLTSCSVCDSSCHSSAGTVSFCGDGVKDINEGCDDGNTQTEDCAYGLTSCTVCNMSCQQQEGGSWYCGDSSLDVIFGEECDDGNTMDGDGCSSTCKTQSIACSSNMDCEEGYSCYESSCVEGCTYQATVACENDNLFYFDSCGEKGNLYIACGDGNLCQNSQCIPACGKVYGYSGIDAPKAAVSTNDGGFLIVGSTDLSGSSDGSGWIVKFDSLGNMEWERTYGDANFNTINEIKNTADGGYILAGTKGSIAGSAGDFWLLKLNSNYDLEWEQVYDGETGDAANSVWPTADGGYILAGSRKLNSDIWVVKTNSTGVMQWDKTINNYSWEIAYSIEQTSDGGYIVAGVTDKVYASSAYMWIIKLDENGNTVWDRKIGGIYYDMAYSIFQLNDDNYISIGVTGSQGWLANLSSTGSTLWEHFYYPSYPHFIALTNDSGYILGGKYTYDSPYYYDMWIQKTDSTGTAVWEKKFGGSRYDEAKSILPLSDGSYIVVGISSSFGMNGSDDAYIMKLSSTGECIW